MICFIFGLNDFLSYQILVDNIQHRGAPRSGALRDRSSQGNIFIRGLPVF